MLASAAVEIDGIYYQLFSSDNTAIVTKKPSGSYTGNIVIPATVTYEDAVYDVTAIGSNAFAYCENMSSISIPNSVTTIYSQAFLWCLSLTSVTIPDGVTSIDDEAFKNCGMLRTINMPDNVPYIGRDVFYGTKWLDDQPDGVVYAGKVAYAYKGDIPSDGHLTFTEGTIGIARNAFSNSNCTSVTIPDGVTYIGAKAFRECTSLTFITIPNSVTSIGVYAFLGTPWFDSQPDGVVYAGKIAYRYKGDVPANTTVKLKEGTIGIADYAFDNCTSLNSVTIPNGVTHIGNGAFDHCTGLTSINIPNSVTYIGDEAFYMCQSLTSVTIPKNVTSLLGRPFAYCSSLTSVTIPNSVTIIGYGAFSDCSSLTSITIPHSVTTIGAEAFIHCDNLKIVEIGKGIKKIYYDAFRDCGKLKDVYCMAEEAPETEDEAFRNTNIGNATLHVLKSDAYNTKYPWMEFQEIVEIKAKVKLNKTKATLEKTKTLTLKPTFTPSLYPDKSVTWKSSNTKVATVSSKGKVTGVKAGTATITCTSNATGAKATCKVTVGYVKLDQTEAILEKTKTMTLTATVYPSKLEDKSVTWKSSNTKVATVTSKGKVKGVKAGTATITCTSNATGLSATCNVTVGYVKLDQAEAILEKTKTMTLTATVYPSKLEDKSVTWKSSNTKVATVSSKGKVKGVKAGTATITCTSNATGLSTTCNVTVGYVKLDQTEVSVKKGKTVTLTPTVYPSKLEDKSVTWTSSNTKVATVTADGKVKGVKTGTATITCTSNATGLSRSCEVTVVNLTLDQYEVTVKKGKTVTLTATVYPSTLEDKSVTWESSDTKIATVTSAGKVKGIRVGTATITCTSVATGLSRTCKVTVIASSSSRSLEGDDDDVTGIETVEEAPALAEPFDVYDLSGRKVLDQVNSLDGLPAGVYIVNGKKMLKK